MKKVLEVQNVKKIYGSRGISFPALEDVSFDIGEGEFVGIMGPSGSGKTTLLNVIATIDKPTAGVINIGGDDVVSMKDRELASFRKNQLGFVFQDFNLLDTLTIGENISLPLALNSVTVKEIKRRLENTADIFGINEILNKYPSEVSGGQKQRAAAARAIINNPELILADEPTGALDSKSASELLGCFSKLNESRGATIMMVTHDPFAASYCKRILFIKDGKIFTELTRSGDRREFFQKVLDVLKVIGGESHDLV